MIILDIEQHSREWHELRRTKIGASDAPVIYGVSRYKNALQLWEEKSVGKKSFTTAAMQRGTDLEPEARATISKQHGTEYKPVVMQSEKYEWMIASLDGWNGECLVEIKCPNQEILDRIALHDIPMDYQVQMQHAMQVSDTDAAILLAWNGNTGIEIKLNRDEELISELVKLEEAFYHNHLLSFIPPEAPIEERSDEEAIEVIENYRQVKARFDEIEEELKIAKESIIYVANDRSFRCRGMNVTKCFRAGNVDYKQIPELKSVDLSQYRKSPTEYWSVR